MFISLKIIYSQKLLQMPAYLPPTCNFYLHLPGPLQLLLYWRFSPSFPMMSLYIFQSAFHKHHVINLVLITAVWGTWALFSFKFYCRYGNWGPERWLDRLKLAQLQIVKVGLVLASFFDSTQAYEFSFFIYPYSSLLLDPPVLSIKFELLVMGQLPSPDSCLMQWVMERRQEWLASDLQALHLSPQLHSLV